MSAEKSEKDPLIGVDGTSVQGNGRALSPKGVRSLQQTLRDIATGPERLWVVTVFSLVVVLGSASMGLALGYSSASIVDFDKLHVGSNPSSLGYTLKEGVAQQGLFGVRVYAAKLNQAVQVYYLVQVSVKPPCMLKFVC